jgi:hypothetical protein
VKVGDIVNINTPTGPITCKLTSIVGDVAIVYLIDITGGYHAEFPLSSVVKMRESITGEDIDKPKRYNKRGTLECWDVIIDQEMDFLEGSVQKYLWRYKEKNGIEDLKKAKVYIDKIIQQMEQKK